MTHNRRRWVYGVIGLLVPLLGCYDYTVLHPTTQTEEFYWELKADHRAVLLSMTPPYNTLQLTVIPYNVDGEELSMDTLRKYTRVTWESADTSAVGISQTGVLTAKKVATRVDVYVTMSIGDLTHKDTIVVGVTPTAPSPLDSLVLLGPPGKNTVAAGGTLAFSVQAKLANGQLLTDVPVSYRVSNRWLADFEGETPGVLSGIVPLDSVYVFATTTVYGVTRRDSLRIYTGYPLRVATSVFVLDARVSHTRELEYVPRFIDPGSAPGSTLMWRNNSGLTPENGVGYPPGGMVIDIIFDHPEFVEAVIPNSPSPIYGQGGNILQLCYDPSPNAICKNGWRKFTQPGEHWYTVQPLGIRGKVTIGER